MLLHLFGRVGGHSTYLKPAAELDPPWPGYLRSAGMHHFAAAEPNLPAPPSGRYQSFRAWLRHESLRDRKEVKTDGGSDAVTFALSNKLELHVCCINKGLKEVVSNSQLDLRLRNFNMHDNLPYMLRAWLKFKKRALYLLQTRVDFPEWPTFVNPRTE